MEFKTVVWRAQGETRNPVRGDSKVERLIGFLVLGEVKGFKGPLLVGSNWLRVWGVSVFEALGV